MVLWIQDCYTRALRPKEKNEDDEEEDDKEGAWIFLFVDLVYVALLSKLSHVVEYCALSVHSFLFVIVIFSVSFVTRLTIDDYACRFKNNDVFHRIMYFAYTMSNFMMSLNVNAKHTEAGFHADHYCKANFYSFGFSVGFLVGRLVILILLAAVVFEDQRVQFTDYSPRKKLSRKLSSSESDQDDEFAEAVAPIPITVELERARSLRRLRYHRKGQGKPNVVPVLEQIYLIYNDTVTKSSLLRFLPHENSLEYPHQSHFTSNPSDPARFKYEYNSAFKQFSGTILKLTISSLVVMIMLGVEYMRGGGSRRSQEKSIFPRAYKVYMFVIAMAIEIGGHFFHYFVQDFNKARKVVEKESVEGDSSWSHHIEPSPAAYSFPPNPRLNPTGIAFVDDDYYTLRIVEYQERLGAFIMMVMGEAVIVLLIPYYETKYAKSAYFFNTASCWLLFLFGIQYYDAQDFGKEEVGGHAMNHSALSRFLYIWLHLALAICVFFTSSSIGVLNAKQRIVDEGGAKRRLLGPDLGHDHSHTFLRLGMNGHRLLGGGGGGGGGGTDEEGGGSSASDGSDDQPPSDWDHKPVVAPEVLMSSSVAMFIIILTILRALHTGLEDLFSKASRPPKTQSTEGPSKSFMKRVFGPYVRLANKISKFLWAILHLSVGWWGLKTPNRNVGAQCALFTVLTTYEILLRFLHPEHKKKVDRRETEREDKKVLRRVGSTSAKHGVLGMSGHDESGLVQTSAGRHKTGSEFGMDEPYINRGSTVFSTMDDDDDGQWLPKSRSNTVNPGVSASTSANRLSLMEMVKPGDPQQNPLQAPQGMADRLKARATERAASPVK